MLAVTYGAKVAYEDRANPRTVFTVIGFTADNVKLAAEDGTITYSDLRQAGWTLVDSGLAELTDEQLAEREGIAHEAQRQYPTERGHAEWTALDEEVGRRQRERSADWYSQGQLQALADFKIAELKKLRADLRTRLNIRADLDRVDWDAESIELADRRIEEAKAKLAELGQTPTSLDYFAYTSCGFTGDGVACPIPAVPGRRITLPYERRDACDLHGEAVEAVAS